MIIAAAAVAEAYHEPIFAARRLRPDLEFLIPARSPEPDWIDRRRPYREHRDTEYRFLEQFAVYNLAAMPGTEEDIFGPFGAWLLDEIMADREGREAMAKRFRGGYGRATRCLADPDCPVDHRITGCEHSDAHLVAWEVAQMLWATRQARFDCERVQPPEEPTAPTPGAVLAVLVLDPSVRKALGSAEVDASFDRHGSVVGKRGAVNRSAWNVGPAS